MESGSDAVMRASRAAITRAKREGRTEITPDDLLVGLLQGIGRFGVVCLGAITIDLEALGVAGEEVGGPGRKPKAAYTPETAAIFDRAARIAQQDGARGVGVAHMLAAFASETGGLMEQLKTSGGFSGADWRAALARWDAEQQAEQGAVGGEPRRDGATDRMLLSPDEAAAFLGVHTQTVRGYIRSGKLPAYRLAGERAIRIKREDLLGLLEVVNPDEAG